MLEILGGGFEQSIDMVADALGVELDASKRTTHEMAVATAPIDSPIGPIEPGRVAAQRFTWQGTVRGEPVITARVNWLMGEEHLDPPWRFGPEGERFEVEITGDPPRVAHLPRPAPGVDRAGPRAQPGHRRDGDALRERDPLRRARRARHQDLPRPAAGRGPRGAALLQKRS